MNKDILMSLLAQAWTLYKDKIFIAVDHQLQVFEDHNPKYKKWFQLIQDVLPVIQMIEMTTTKGVSKSKMFKAGIKPILVNHELILTEKDINKLREDALSINEQEN